MILSMLLVAFNRSSFKNSPRRLSASLAERMWKNAAARCAFVGWEVLQDDLVTPFDSVV